MTLVESMPDAEDPTLDSVLELSTERNVIILLVDTLQSDVFEELLNENPELKSKLFRFYILSKLQLDHFLGPI